MSRSPALLPIALALAGYGVYRALYVPAMLVGPPGPLLLLGFLLQAACGIVAGVGVGRGASWAPLAIGFLGASIAVTALVEGFVLGIVPYLRALLEAVVAFVVTFLIAAYVRGQLERTTDDPTLR